MQIMPHKEIVVCDECHGTGETDKEEKESGHDSYWIKVPCWKCGETGRLLKITTVEYLQIKGGETP